MLNCMTKEHAKLLKQLEAIEKSKVKLMAIRDKLRKQMSPQAIKMFESDGWSVDCESPLEIYNAQSRATGWAAQIVMEYYEDRCKGKYERLRPLRKIA